MGAASYLLVSTLLTAGVIAGVHAVQQEPPKEEAWVLIGSTQFVRFDVHRATIETNAETQSVQFVLRSQFKVAEDGVKTVLEPTVILCKSRTMITTGRSHYSEAHKELPAKQGATVYEDPGVKGHVVTVLIQMACDPTDTVTEKRTKKSNVSI